MGIPPLCPPSLDFRICLMHKSSVRYSGESQLASRNSAMKLNSAECVFLELQPISPTHMETPAAAAFFLRREWWSHKFLFVKQRESIVTVGWISWLFSPGQFLSQTSAPGFHAAKSLATAKDLRWCAFSFCSHSLWDILWNWARIVQPARGFSRLENTAGLNTCCMPHKKCENYLVGRECQQSK